jgi:hypothetical protein
MDVEDQAGDNKALLAPSPLIGSPPAQIVGVSELARLWIFLSVAGDGAAGPTVVDWFSGARH